MRAVQLEAARGLALGDPGESTKVGEPDLHRLSLHVEEGRAIQLLVPRTHLVARFVQHPYPVADEMAFTG